MGQSKDSHLSLMGQMGVYFLKLCGRNLTQFLVDFGAHELNESHDPPAPASPPFVTNKAHVSDAKDSNELMHRIRSSGMLFTIGILGVIFNLVLMFAMMKMCNFNKRPMAVVLFHHAFLDFLKVVYVFSVAHSVTIKWSPVYCIYQPVFLIISITTTIFNVILLTVHLAHAVFTLEDANFPTLKTQQERYPQSMELEKRTTCGKGCCGSFSIITVWSASFILNFGLAILPATADFDVEIGLCTFKLGLMRSYVIHLLFFCLMTFCVVVISTYVKMIHARIRKRYNYHFSLAKATGDVEIIDIREINLLKFRHRQLMMILLLECLFVIFWYPLLFVTVTDRYFKAPPFSYTCLTIYALSSILVNPVIIAMLTFIKEEKYGNNVDEHLTLYPRNGFMPLNHCTNNIAQHNIFDTKSFA